MSHSFIPNLKKRKEILGKKTVKLTWENVSDSDLTRYRLSVVRKAVVNCLTTAGYQLSDTAGAKWIRFATKNHQVTHKDDCERSVKPVETICGAILNAQTGRKEMVITTEEYRRLRLRDLQIVSETKMSDNSGENSLKILADASVKLTLLQVKVTQAVLLNLTEDSVRNRETGSKGATFVLYNVSRLAAIRKKYFQGVSNQVYPPIPPIDEVDFSTLSEPEEWSILFNFLLEYPSLIQRCAEDILNGRPAIHHVCKFLFDLCSIFSVHYKRNRILLESKQHLLPLLQARLLLAMSIEQILKNGLSLLNIETVEEM